jgi:hypothetical protein
MSKESEFDALNHLEKAWMDSRHDMSAPDDWTQRPSAPWKVILVVVVVALASYVNWPLLQSIAGDIYGIRKNSQSQPLPR